MSKTVHTPGPWRLDGKRAVEAQAFDGSWKHIASPIRGGSPEQADANATLIAAAPDLLKELKNCVWLLEDLQVTPGLIQEQAKAAIAKAARHEIA